MYVICYYKFIFKIHIHLESFDRTSQARFIKIAHRHECLHQNPNKRCPQIRSPDHCCIFVASN